MPQRRVGEKTRLVPLDEDRHFENVVRRVNDPDVSDGPPLGDHIDRASEGQIVAAAGDERVGLAAVGRRAKGRAAT